MTVAFHSYHRTAPEHGCARCQQPLWQLATAGLTFEKKVAKMLTCFPAFSETHM